LPVVCKENFYFRRCPEAAALIPRKLAQVALPSSNLANLLTLTSIMVDEIHNIHEAYLFYG